LDGYTVQDIGKACVASDEFNVWAAKVGTIQWWIYLDQPSGAIPHPRYKGSCC